jgi:signal transduction histidine kinase
VISVVGIVTTTALISAIDSGAQAAAQGLAAALCFYSLAGRSRVRTGVDVALFAATLGAMALTRQGNVANGVVAWLLFLLLPYVVGRAVASRRGLTRELQAGAEWARREQEADAHAAAAEERARIAREIHDVVAHSLSVMVIQAVAAREVAAHDPATARAALQAVQLSGREALLDMRRQIGVLGRGDIALAGTTTSGLGQLHQLAQRARMSGLPVELTVDGQPRDLPGTVDLIAFRIVQEALTNSIKHAGPASASVTVRFESDILELEICDDGRGAGTEATLLGAGQGLLGMRERVALIHGEIFAGQRPGGGFRVHARLPVGEALLT